MNPKIHRLPAWCLPGKPPSLVSLLVAVGLVSFSTAARFYLEPYLTSLVFFTYFPAVMAAGWFGGLWPGVAATLLSAGCVDYFWMGHMHGFSFQPDDLIQLSFFTVCGVTISGLNGLLHLLIKRESEAKEEYQVTLSSIGDAVIVTDATGNITFINPVACALTGVALENALGTPLTELFHIVNEQTRQLAPNPVADVFSNGLRVGLANHTVLLSKDGREIPIDDSAAPIKDREGEVIGAVLVFSDITERRKAEEALRQAQRDLAKHAYTLEKTVEQRTAELHAHVIQLEEFSYTVSHDLRAPLRAMSGYASAVLHEYGDQIDSQGKSFLEQIVKAAKRMDHLIHDVLAYSKLARKDISIHPVNLEELVQRIIDHYPNIKASKAVVTVRSPLLAPLGNESLLTQSLSNLIGNAVKFVHPGQVPKVEIWSERRGEKVRLFIKDNGIGIKPEHQGKLFALFERVDPRSHYEGTGMGLAIVRKAMERMGGVVALDSDGTSGSTFWIELPASSEE